jgi:RNA polymerase sigma-70 factor (ECF subfamily)
MKEDDPLVARAQAGDKAAWDALVARHHRGVRRFLLCKRRVDVAHVEDVVQETFLAAQTGISRFERRSTFFTWLIAIAIHKAIDDAERRTNVRETERQLGDIDSELVVADRAPGPDERLHDARLAQALDASIAQLVPTLRDVFMCVAIAGMTRRETAEFLNIPEGTVGTRSADAVARMRRSLKRLGFSAVVLAVLLDTEEATPSSTAPPEASGSTGFSARASAIAAVAIVSIAAVAVYVAPSGCPSDPARHEVGAAADVQSMAPPQTLSVDGGTRLDAPESRAPVPRHELPRALLSPSAAWSAFSGTPVRYEGGSSRGAPLPMTVTHEYARPILQVSDSGAFKFGTCRGVVSGDEFVARCVTEYESPVFLLVGVLHRSGTFVAANAYQVYDLRALAADPMLEPTGSYRALLPYATRAGLVFAAEAGAMLISSACAEPVTPESARGGARGNLWWTDLTTIDIANRLCTSDICGTDEFEDLSVACTEDSTTAHVTDQSLIGLAGFSYSTPPFGWRVASRCVGLTCAVATPVSAVEGTSARWAFARARRTDIPALQTGDGPGLGVRLADVGACPSEHSLGIARWMGADGEALEDQP